LVNAGVSRLSTVNSMRPSSSFVVVSAVIG
jgi:hypothetical protein